MKTYKHDIAIIGAGPSGLFAAFECGFLGYTCAIMDALPEIGGQLTALYPEKPIYDIPGHPEILAKDLVANLAQQAAAFSPTYLLGAPVMEMKKEGDTFILRSSEANVHAKVVIVAGGGGMFTPRKPKLDQLEGFESAGSVHYAVKNKQQYAGQTVVIAGGGDSAVDWAVELAEIAAQVHIVHRRVDFRAVDATVAKMQALAEAGKITVHTGHVSELHGEAGVLSSVDIQDLDGNILTTAADKMLCFFGLAPNAGPFGNWNIELAGKKIKTEAITQKTSVEGVLAIGDMADYDGKISLILVGFAEAAQAAKSAQAIINPEKKFKVVYSTAHKPGE